MTTLKNPLVSVIMPVHNRFELVDQSIASVHKQTYRPIELIIVDDLSDASYIPNLSSGPNFDVKVIRHEMNKGPGASRETGRLAANGDYIAYLDSDDLWHPEKLEKQVTMLQSHPESGMCYCQTVKFSTWPLTGKEQLRIHSDEEFREFFPTILFWRPWSTSAYIWTRAAVELIGPWFPGWDFEDFEYEVRAGCQDISITYVPEVLCYCRTGSSSLTHIKSRFKFEQHVKAVLRISQDLKKYQRLDDDDIWLHLDRLFNNITSESLELKDRRLLTKILFARSNISKTIKEKALYLSLLICIQLTPKRLSKRIVNKFRNFLTLN